MKLRTGRKAVASAIATAALALSVLPGAAFASGGIGVDLGPLNLQRDCGDASVAFGENAQGQCSYNIAQPSASQDASAVAVNQNEAATVGLNLQKQVNVLAPDANVYNNAFVGSVKPEAKLIVESGSVDVYGHEAKIDMSGLEQKADAAPHGFVSVINDTGSVGNVSSGDNWAIANAGAANNTNSGLFGSADTNARDAYIGGWGGDAAGHVAGNGPSASGFGVDGGWGGSNVNLGLGASLAGGGDGGFAASGAGQAIFPFFAFGEASNGEAESAARANGGDGTSGYGAQVDPLQTAGNGGDAWFTLTGRGGDASGAINANGGAGTLTNTNSVSGNPIATGTANGGTTGDVSSGNYQFGNTGQNNTTVNMNGGLAANSLNVGVEQSGAVTGYSGGVTNNGSVSASSPIDIYQGSNPSITMSNTPAQNGSNSASTSQSSASGAQTVSPGQTVSTGAQNAGNLGLQDALKAFGSFNTDNHQTTVDNSNQGNVNVGDVEVDLASSSKGGHGH